MSPHFFSTTKKKNEKKVEDLTFEKKMASTVYPVGTTGERKFILKKKCGIVFE